MFAAVIIALVVAGEAIPSAERLAKALALQQRDADECQAIWLELYCFNGLKEELCSGDLDCPTYCGYATRLCSPPAGPPPAEPAAAEPTAERSLKQYDMQQKSDCQNPCKSPSGCCDWLQQTSDCATPCTMSMGCCRNGLKDELVNLEKSLEHYHMQTRQDAEWCEAKWLELYCYNGLQETLCAGECPTFCGYASYCEDVEDAEAAAERSLKQYQMQQKSDLDECQNPCKEPSGCCDWMMQTSTCANQCVYSMGCCRNGFKDELAALEGARAVTIAKLREMK